MRARSSGVQARVISTKKIFQVFGDFSLTSFRWKWSFVDGSLLASKPTYQFFVVAFVVANTLTPAYQFFVVAFVVANNPQTMVQDNKRRREDYAPKKEGLKAAAKKQKQEESKEGLEAAAKKQKQEESKAIKRHVPRLIALAEEAELPLDDNSCTSDYFEAR